MLTTFACATKKKKLIPLNQKIAVVKPKTNSLKAQRSSKRWKPKVVKRVHRKE